MVWSRCLGNIDQPVRADARTWPLPWIEGDVMIQKHDAQRDTMLGWRRSADGEQGEVVVKRQYPYMALTVWCACS